MDNLVNNFIQDNNGKRIGNTPQNFAECVGCVEVYIRSLGLDQVWGNADDLYTNAPDASFIKIPNSPTAIPQQGDIIVWSGDFNGGVGHTGIATGKADVNTFDCFEQNDPIGSPCHVKTYNYAYVTGWIRPTVALQQTVAVPSATFEELVRKSTEFDKFVSGGYTSIDAVNNKITDLQNQLTDCESKVVVPVKVDLQPVVSGSTQTVEVPIVSATPITPPAQSNPAPIPTPIKPRMDIRSNIVFILTNIFNTLKSWMQ